MTAFGRALIAFVILILLFVAGGGWLSIRFFQDIQAQSRTEIYRRLAVELGGNIESSLAIGLPLQDLASLQGILNDSRARAPSVATISVYDVAGIVRFGTNQGNVGQQTGWPSGAALDSGDLRTLMQGDELVVIQPVRGAFGEAAGAVALRVPQARALEERRLSVVRLTRDTVIIGCIAVLAAALAATAEAWRRSRRLDILRSALMGLLEGERPSSPPLLVNIADRIALLQSGPSEAPAPAAAEAAIRDATMAQLARDRALRLGAIMVLILSAAAGSLIWTVYAQVERTVPSLVAEQARLAGHGVAAQIERALSYGIPIDRLVGLDVLLSRTVADNKGFERLEVTSPEGRVLYSSDATKAIAPGTEQFALPIGRAGDGAGNLVVTRRAALPGDMMMPLLRDLAWLTLALLIIGLEAVALGLLRLGNLSLASAYRVMGMAGAGDFRFLASTSADDDATGVVAAINAVTRWACRRQGGALAQRVVMDDRPHRKRLCLFGSCLALTLWVCALLHSRGMPGGLPVEWMPPVMLGTAAILYQIWSLRQVRWGVLTVLRTVLLAVLAGICLGLGFGEGMTLGGQMVLGAVIALPGAILLLGRSRRTAGAV